MDEYSLIPQDPAELQALQAQLLRRRMGQQAMEEANMRANQFNNLAAITQMANNPGMAEAAQMASKNQQARYKPQSMGQMGFALPASGEFVSSPMYEDERNASRQAVKVQQRERLDAQRQTQQERLQAAEDRAAERLQYQRERDAERTALQLTMAGMRDDASRESRLLRASLAGVANQGRQAAKDQAAEERRARGLDTNVVKFGAAMEKSGLPEFMSALDTAEGRLSQHKTGELPGYGRVWGSVPSWMLPTEAQMARADMSAAANILLKSRSGAAVTTPEEKRFLNEIASGAGMDEKALRHGWANLRANVEQRLRNMTAGYGPDVVDEYVRRGGRDFRAQPGDKYLQGN